MTKIVFENLRDVRTGEIVEVDVDDSNLYHLDSAFSANAADTFKHTARKPATGKFTISRDYIDEHFDIVQAAMSKVVVVRAEYMFHNDSIEYTALSFEFRNVADGSAAPLYDVIISGTHYCNREYNIEFRECE